MAHVAFDRATRRFDGTVSPAVDALTLTIPDGTMCALVGPHGSGKSTALRMLAGQEEVDSGRVLVDRVDISRVPPPDRGVVMVFETYALYPHMTVAANLGFPLRVEGVDPDEVDQRVREVADALELGIDLDAKPANISGMERHLVALGRALVRRPRVLLMDDPLDNLTRAARTQTRQHLTALQQRLAVTTLYATRHADDALAMAGQIAVLDRGRLLQAGTPAEVTNTPASDRVREILDEGASG